ncbi:MAG TPA: nodulation protein NfeD, partial [Afifellaceae bacterium]|nr:nodulation protein NfeD [Afifellaceae bacterium]
FKLLRLAALILMIAAGMHWITQWPATAQTSGTVLLVELDGPIGPAASDYVSRALEKAQETNAKIVILRIDTPGGLDTSTRDIIRDILASPIPVIGYVAPSGARAASAGTYILYACHVAAMAPGTNVGAATPIQIGGGFPKLPATEEEKDEDKPAHPTLADKAISDSIAYLRSLAQMRGRNVEWAEKAVRDAASISAEDALAMQVIEILATDIPDLLVQLDGRSVKAAFGVQNLATQGLAVSRHEADWRTRLLAVITNPNIAYILMLIGIYGLIFEFYSPGAIVPGVAGAICLFLALYAFNVLPVNYAGLALLVLGISLMVTEAFVPSFGALGLGGAAAFVLGSIMLLDIEAPGFQVSPVLIGSVATVSSGLFVFVMMMLMRARRRLVVTGPEELLHSRAEVVEWRGRQGRVRVHGELWKARA